MIKKYNNFINEKTDDDTPAYMRDELDKYSQYDDYDEDEYDEDEYEEDDEGEYEQDSESEDEEDDMSNLVYWIKKLFNNADFDVDVDVDKLDISIYCPLSKVDHLSNVLKAVDVAHKLAKDILPQYKNAVTLFETKKGIPLLTFDFTYSDGRDELPFD
jgi:hypothetical protein